MPVQTRFHIRRKIFVFTVCLSVSTFLWLLNDLNRVQTTVVNIPVRFTNLPYDMVTTNSLPSSVETTIEATGFTLLWRHFTSEHKVLDVTLLNNQAPFLPGKSYSMNMNSYLNEISRSLGGNIKIRKIFPDTFSIRFEKKFVKKVPVKLVADITYQKEYYPSDELFIDPDSIIISGSRQRVMGINEVHTLTVQLKDQKETYQGKTGLETLDGITYNINHVDIRIPISQYTEKRIELKITPVNVPSGYELNTIPDAVSLKLLVPVSSYESIIAAQFQVDAPFPGTQASTNKLLLSVGKKPVFVKVLEIEPASVEYKIKSKR